MKDPQFQIKEGNIVQGDIKKHDEHTSTDQHITCLLYTSDAADERSSVDLGGRRIIKQKITE